MLFLNLSNHPVSQWSADQLEAARQYGEVRDLPFPQINPDATEDGINSLVEQYLSVIRQVGSPQEVVVHLMGELTFCFALVERLKAEGYTCLASTTERIVSQIDSQTKQATFRFVKFRKY